MLQPFLYLKVLVVAKFARQGIPVTAGTFLNIYGTLRGITTLVVV